MSDCCRTCRLRKVKCSGNPGNGPCSNCSRLDLACSFVVPSSSIQADRASRTTPSHSHTEAGTIRKRAQRACSQCHAHKTKCSGGLPKCKRCDATGLACEYTPARRRFANVRFDSPVKSEEGAASVSQPLRPEGASAMSPASSSGTGSTPFFIDASTLNLNAEDMLVRKDIILTHMDAYLQNLYSVPCLGFLHPEISYQEIQDNTFPPAQAAAMCAVASFFVNPGEAGREFGRKCSQQVEMHIYRNIYKFSENALILFALNILFNLLDGSFAKVWQCFGVASRLMIGLQLNWDVIPRNTTFVQQECLRRIAWQLFTLDRLLAGGYEEYIACRAENMKIRLPCNEAAFRENRPVVAERLHDKPGRCSSALGLHGIQIRLIDLRHRIQVTTKKLAMPSGAKVSHLEPSKVMADINALQNELTRFHASIPDDLRLSDQSMSRYAESQHWRGYVFFHTHMAGSHMDLYRFSLPGPRDQASIDILRKLPREFLARSQRQAVAHAMCLARFIDAIWSVTERMPSTGGLRLVGDYSITHMTAQCIRVLLVALQYNLYQDLADTTAPLWRGGPADEAQIKAFIGIMMEATEPWGQVFDMAKHAHDCNKVMLEEFNRRRKLTGQGNTPATSEQNVSEGKRLPGPNLILNVSGADEGRNRASDMLVSDWWMGQPATPQSSPSTASPLTVSYPLAEVNLDVEFGPPGVPMVLAQARSLSMGSNEVPLLYNNPDTAIAADKASWTPPDLGAMLHSGYRLMQLTPAAPGGGMSTLHMDATIPDGSVPDPTTMFQPQQPTPTEQQPFMQPQQGMFMNAYAGHYPNGDADPAAYIQQNIFG